MRKETLKEVQGRPDSITRKWFGFHPEAWWMGVPHLPLLLISLYAFLLYSHLVGHLHVK